MGEKSRENFQVNPGKIKIKVMSNKDRYQRGWSTATFTANHAVIYDDTLASDDLIASIDFGGAKSV